MLYSIVSKPSSNTEGKLHWTFEATSEISFYYTKSTLIPEYKGFAEETFPKWFLLIEDWNFL